MKLRLLSVLIVLALVAASAKWFRLNATPPSGIAFEAIGRATVPAFDVKRKEKDLNWRIDLKTDQPIDVATQVVTFQPGGFSAAFKASIALKTALWAGDGYSIRAGTILQPGGKALSRDRVI